MDFLFKIITVIIVVLVGYLFIGAVINTMYEAGTMFDGKKKANGIFKELANNSKVSLEEKNLGQVRRIL